MTCPRSDSLCIRTRLARSFSWLILAVQAQQPMGRGSILKPVSAVLTPFLPLGLENLSAL